MKIRRLLAAMLAVVMLFTQLGTANVKAQDSRPDRYQPGLVNAKAITITDISMSTDGVVVNWKAVSGATTYTIYLGYYDYSTEEGSMREVKLGTTKNTTYTYKDLKMYPDVNNECYYIIIKTTVSGTQYEAYEYLDYEPFSDVEWPEYDPDDQEGWYQLALKWLSIAWAFDHGIVGGTSKTTYSPEKSCTRAQFCIMLYKLYGKPNVTIPSNLPFSDIADQTSNTKKAIIWCANNGIVEGKNGKFNPKGNITRAQLAIMLYKAAGKPSVSGMSCDYTDISDQTSNTKNAITWIYNIGEYIGIDYSTGNKKFSPKANGTRMQLTQMLFGFNVVEELIETYLD